MFDQGDQPRIFAIPPGVDFAEAFINGLTDRALGMPPADWARVEIYVNTSRMQRRMRSVFDAGPARLLPRVRLITDLANDPVSADIPPAASPLRRRLELSQFITRLLDHQPDLAPRAALYDLSDSLAALMDEMQGEGVDPETIRRLDVTDQSGHWDRALRFVNIVAPYFGPDNKEPDTEARQRLVIETLSRTWATKAPAHPIIVAGSTGSRGATAAFMKAVSSLPQGAIVLPGYDCDLPDQVWQSMDDVMTSEDHPQYRFRRLMDLIGFAPDRVKPWSTETPVRPARNRLISLSLRPAPVTDQWREAGPGLGDMIEATDGLTLLEASSPRAEAETIALRLRQAAAEGITAALISPDRMLTRQVTAALDRWNLIPDDSAGTPLALSPPGRLLRHVADLFVSQLTSETLLILLKHPLSHSARDDRGEHLRHTRDLELHLRRHGPPFPTADTLNTWAAGDDSRKSWADWLAQLLPGENTLGDRLLSEHLIEHLLLAEAICAGPDAEGAGGLWDEAAGREAKRICDQLLAEADAGGSMSASDYAVMFGAILSRGEVRDRDAGHPKILIWGTLEARVQGADLTILGGMNEGVWPSAPAADPWLNRAMRLEAGLLLPERRIGLSAHDYQQAVAGSEVWITRSKRSSDAETVPSRWVNRLTNLLGGLSKQRGPEALAAMRARGNHWAAMAAKLSGPVARTPPAARPSPRPPVAARPDRISVTQIKTLIRDPFSIYADKVLRLHPLDPLAPNADAPLRGIIIHKVLERFISEGHSAADHGALMRIAHEIFERDCPCPTIRAQWLARMARSTDKFLSDEADRQTGATQRMTELRGKITVPHVDVTLTGTADRIDLTDDGAALIYDYKTGAVPTGPQQEHFDKQLLLEAAMVERGAFTSLGPKTVASATFIGINAEMKNAPAPLKKHPPDVVWTELETLLSNWQRPDRGYTARLALFLKNDVSPYDHLSRYGEWDTSDQPVPEDLT